MLDFLFFFLRLRVIITLVILYFFLNIASHGKLTWQMPDFQNISVTNITKGLRDVKDQIANLFNRKGRKDEKSDKSNDNILEQVKKSVNNWLNTDRSK